MASTSSTLPDSNPDLARAHAQFTASLQIIGPMTVGGTFYGFMTTTATLCARSLIRTRQCRSRRHLAFLLAYIGALWMAGTVLIVGMSAVAVDTFVIHASSSLESPYVQVPATGGFTLVATTAYWMVLILSDGMMIWRFKVVWSTSRLYRYLVTAPVVFYMGILTLGFFAFVVFSGGSFWGGDTVKEDLITVMALSSLCLNVYVTTLIAGRLFLYRRRFKANWGLPDTKHYTSIGPILVESYLPVTLWGIPYVVTYLLDNPAVYMVTSVLGQMQLTAPLVVMLRVSRGVAWDSSTTPRSVESAVDRALEAHAQQMVQTTVQTMRVGG